MMSRYDNNNFYLKKIEKYENKIKQLKNNISLPDKHKQHTIKEVQISDLAGNILYTDMYLTYNDFINIEIGNQRIFLRKPQLMRSIRGTSRIMKGDTKIFNGLTEINVLNLKSQFFKMINQSVKLTAVKLSNTFPVSIVDNDNTYVTYIDEPIKGLYYSTGADLYDMVRHHLNHENFTVYINSRTNDLIEINMDDVLSEIDLFIDDFTYWNIEIHINN